MSDFDSHITVELIEDAKDTKCEVKEITLDNHKLKIETPFKILYGKKLTKNAVSQIVNDFKNPLFEIEKFCNKKSIELLSKKISNGDNYRTLSSAFNENFGLKQHLEDTFRKNVIISCVFQYYPINNITLRNNTPEYIRFKDDEYKAFLRYIHSSSTAFVLTPDVMLPQSGKRTFSIDEYIRFIDNSMEVLQSYNNKPIFVPVQIDLPMNDLKKVLGHYKGNGFTNLWINFKAQKCERSHASKLAIITDQIDNFFKRDEHVIYFSHMKQERDVTENETPAYEMFPPFRGADFIGITRNQSFPPKSGDIDEIAVKKGFSDKYEYQSAVKLRKFSLFNADSYKYVIPSICSRDSIDEKLFESIQNDQSSCNLFNGILINNELRSVRKQITDTRIIRPYLESKSGVIDGMDVFSYALKTKSRIKKSYQKLIIRN